MGIPSYFGYLLKNHNNIFKSLNNVKKIDNLYIDANSIIYNNISNTYKNFTDITFDNNKFEDILIINTINSIKELINKLHPNNNIIIAFDGCAPLAKIHQQKTRRFKNNYLNHKFNKNFKWDTCAISPGTEFMKKLDLSVTNFFNKKSNKVLLFLSSELGEGEHKIFSYIRNNKPKHINKTTIIYGLDADLIMLSLNHLSLCNMIYLYRDDNTDNSDNNNFFSINELAKELIITIKGDNIKNDNNISDNNIIKDYILICFLLGNDFMPHFPSLNIRLNGISNIINIYSEHFYKVNKTLVYNDSEYYLINMKNFKEFIRLLSLVENNILINIHKSRKKIQYNYIKNNYIDLNDENIFNNIPIFDRNIEEFINPNEVNWEDRYYYSLFNIDMNIDRQNIVKKIVDNYIEVLLWTLNYYNKDCINWRIVYNYNYPPLFKDLYSYIPYFDNEINIVKEYNPYHTLCTLIYIIPPSSYNLLPDNINNYIKNKYDLTDYKNNDINFFYAYCKYFWESHIINDINLDINIIEKDVLKIII